MSLSGSRRSISTATSKWKVTVGLEVHAQLATATKLFSCAPNRFDGHVNSDLAPFDVALPGTQPSLNKHAVLLAVRAALALDCKVNRASSFDRKHYFYPDQPAGYQITQNYNALAKDGSFCLYERDGLDQAEPLRVGIAQVQIEQDTARTTYFDTPPQSLVDLNRNGTPLVEIVTTPSIPSAKAAGAALRKIQAILRAVGASDANMEAGGMRCDVNVSVTTEEDRHLGPSRRVEIKNLASGRVVMDAVNAESARQISVLEAGGTVGKETRGYNIEKKQTFLSRTKESATDYRYMPEPDLPPLQLSEKFLEKCQAALPELPDDRLNRLVSEPFGLALKDAKVLVEDPAQYAFYKAVLDKIGLTGKAPKVVSNWILHELAGRHRVMAESGQSIRVVTVEQLAELLRLVLSATLNGSEGKVVLQDILDDKGTVSDIVAARKLGHSFDHQDLKRVVAVILAANADKSAKLCSGDPKLMKWFIGQVMRESKGKANAPDIEAALKSSFNSSRAEQ